MELKKFFIKFLLLITCSNYTMGEVSYFTFFVDGVEFPRGYPVYVEECPGFERMEYPVSILPTGKHTVKIAACDKDDNCSAHTSFLYSYYPGCIKNSFSIFYIE